MSIENIVKTRLPNFGYQLQLASGAVEKHIQTKEDIKKFLNAIYGGRGLNGELGFDVEGGAIFRNLDNLEMTKWLSEEMLSYYADQYAKNGMHGTREQQYSSSNPLRLTFDSMLVSQPPAKLPGRASVSYGPSLMLQLFGDFILTNPRLKKRNLDVPVLFIQATKDAALPPAMSKGMERFIPHLTRKSVPTGHWALWEAPQQVNDMVKEWLKLTEGLKSNL